MFKSLPLPGQRGLSRPKALADSAHRASSRLFLRKGHLCRCSWCWNSKSRPVPQTKLFARGRGLQRTSGLQHFKAALERLPMSHWQWASVLCTDTASRGALQRLAPAACGALARTPVSRHLQACKACKQSTDIITDIYACKPSPDVQASRRVRPGRAAGAAGIAGSGGSGAHRFARQGGQTSIPGHCFYFALLCTL